jgi:para-aminobenzoate synthetase / 4-amino-4-deoxychorismate lyase
MPSSGKMPHLLAGAGDSWKVDTPSAFEEFFLRDNEIQTGWFVSFHQHPKLGAGWLAYRNPIKTLVAWELNEVIALLDSIDQDSKAGLIAAGFVGFDAAAAFDPALTAHRLTTVPLACFHVYDEQPRFYKEVLCTRCADELPIDWRPEMDRDVFLAKCEQVRKHLANGDTYQVNLSFRLHGDLHSDLASVFANLAAEDPPPYASLFLSEHVQVASLSPELFFERSGPKLRCCPMKGTAPLGNSPAETAANAEKLHFSEKDRAENLMVLDMIRNDLGKIAEVGSVRATSIFEVEAFPTVLQMTSTVEAITDRPLSQVFKALFPCASIVGAPKVSTMRIIGDLEMSPRGVYTGAIGTVGPGQEARFAVAIRTITAMPISRDISYGAGSGIVWDSVAEAEWRETMLKTEALHQSSPEWSLIETFRWPDSTESPIIERHLDRLAESARSLGVRFDRKAAIAKIEALASGPLRVRLLLNYLGEVTIESQPLSSPPTRIQASVAQTSVCSEDPSLRVKSNRRRLYNRHLQLNGGDEVLLWNERGEVTEFCKGNLVAKLDGKFITPPLVCGLLPGVLRSVLLESKEVIEEKIHLTSLSKAEDLFRINSLTGWVPVDLINHISPEKM